MTSILSKIYKNKFSMAVVFLLAIIIGTMTGCAGAEDIPSQSTEETNDMPEVAAATNTSSWYGSYIVKDYIIKGVTAIGNDEAEGLMWFLVEYSPDEFNSDGILLEAPAYRETLVSREEFAAMYSGSGGGCTFETFGIEGDSLLEVTIDNSYELGNTFYVWDENRILVHHPSGAFLIAERGERSDIVLTDEHKSFLEAMCYYMPTFVGISETKNEDFWRRFIFNSYTSVPTDEFGKYKPIYGEGERVTVYREDLGFEEGEFKISERDVQEYIRLVFGTGMEMPEFKPAFEDMKEGQTALYYQDGYYYIGESDFGEEEYTFRDLEVFRKQNDTSAIVSYDLLTRDDNGEWEVVGTVQFHLNYADNSNGFVIVGKEIMDAPVVPNYYSSVSDVDGSGVYLGGVGRIYKIDSESGAEILYSTQHIAGAALYEDYVFSMEYNVTDNGMTADLIKIKKDGSDKEVLTQISAGSYDLRIIDNILVITEQILGDYGLETVFYSYTLDDEGNLASDTPQDAYAWFDLPDGYEDSMRFLINPWFSTKYLGYSCFTKVAGVMDINSVWISRGNQGALEEVVTCSGQPLLTGDTIFYCDSNGEALKQHSLSNTQEAVLYEIPDGDSLSLLTYDSEWIYFVQRPTIDEHNELSSSIMRVNMKDHRTEKIYELQPGNVMSNFNVYSNDCYFILSATDNTQWLCCDLVNGDVTNISAED